LFAGKLTGPSRPEGSGILSGVADTGLELFISKGILFLAKKGVEASRYYASEAMRNPALQKKAINYGMKKARPAIEKVGRELLDQLSTKVRPNYRYKTDIADLDGAGLTFIRRLESSLPPKKVGPCLGTIIPAYK